MPRVLRLVGLLISMFVCVWTLALVYRHTIGTRTLAWSNYAYAELLINYGPGFIRRGLIGSFLGWTTHGLSSLKAMNELLFFNFALLVICLYVMALVRSRYKGWTAALVLLIPGGVFHMAFTDEMFFRKEAFFFSFLALVGTVITVARSLPHGALRRNVSYCLVTVIWCGGLVCSLIHEAFAFLAAPAAMYLLVAAMRLGSARQSLSRSKEVATAFGFVAVTTSLFILQAVFFHGGLRAALYIWNTLSPGDRALLAASGPGGIGSLSAGPNELWNMPLKILEAGMSWWYVAPLALLLLYCAVLVALNALDRDDHAVSRWLECYAVLALCNAPMFILGFDWGRWVTAITMSFLLVWLAVREDELFEPLSYLRLPGVRARMSLLNVGYAAELAAAGGHLVRRHQLAAISLLLLFALTFRLPEVMLIDSNTFIGNAGVRFIAARLHRPEASATFFPSTRVQAMRVH